MNLITRLLLVGGLCVVAGLLMASYMPGTGSRASIPVVQASNSNQGQNQGQNNKQTYQEMARQDAREVGIPENLFVAQIRMESDFRADARGAAGEIGIAQFMPETAAGLGVDPADPVASLKAAAGLMSRYYHAWGRDYAKALAGYNCGGGCLQNAVNQGGANWQDYIPASTRNYIAGIYRFAGEV